MIGKADSPLSRTNPQCRREHHRSRQLPGAGSRTQNPGLLRGLRSSVTSADAQAHLELTKVKSLSTRIHLIPSQLGRLQWCPSLHSNLPTDNQQWRLEDLRPGCWFWSLAPSLCTEPPLCPDRPQERGPYQRLPARCLAGRYEGAKSSPGQAIGGRA